MLFQCIIIVLCFVVVELYDEDDDVGDLTLSFFLLLQQHSMQRGQ